MVKTTKKPSQEVSIKEPTEIVVTPENREAIIATCEKEGLTREKCIRAIAEGLEAMRMVIGKDGTVYEEVDHDKRLRASLAGLELRGEIKSKESLRPTTYNTVVYQWKR